MKTAKSSKPRKILVLSSHDFDDTLKFPKDWFVSKTQISGDNFKLPAQDESFDAIVIGVTGTGEFDKIISNARDQCFKVVLVGDDAYRSKFASYVLPFVSVREREMLIREIETPPQHLQQMEYFEMSEELTNKGKFSRRTIFILVSILLVVSVSYMWQADIHSTFFTKIFISTETENQQMMHMIQAMKNFYGEV